MATKKLMANEEKAMAVARLKRSREEQHTHDFRTGMADGRVWAIQRGECRDLEALEWLDAGDGIEFADLAEGNRQRVFARALAENYRDRFGREPAAADMLASMFPPNRPYTAGYVDGFQLGASMVWDELKPQVVAEPAPKA